MSLEPDYLLVDATAFVFRAFHAFKRMERESGRSLSSNDQPTGAIFGSMSSFNKLMKDYPRAQIVLAFDPPGPTERTAQYPEYKGNRPSLDEELRSQFPIIKELVQCRGLPYAEVKGQEADDVIGTLSVQCKNAGKPAYIVTMDKDMMQLVHENSRFLHPNKAAIDDQGVKEAMGVFPNQIAAFLALVGDSVDNIPGVKGIGKKTAIALLEAHGSLPAIYQASASGTLQTTPRHQQSIALAIENGQLDTWMDLTTIRTSIELDEHVLEPKTPNYGRLVEICQQLNLNPKRVEPGLPDSLDMFSTF